jgi:hypothetical protein
MMTKKTATMFHSVISEVRDIVAYAEKQTTVDSGQKVMDQYARCQALLDAVSMLHDQVNLNTRMFLVEFKTILDDFQKHREDHINFVKATIESNETNNLRADRSSGDKNGDQTRSLFTTTDY